MTGSRRAAYAVVASVAIASVVGGCGGGGSTSPNVFIVQYRLDTTGNLRIDSLKYDDGHGALVKVALPTTGWVMTFGVAAGGSVEAHAWGVGSSSSSARIKATWTLSGVSAESDSSHVTCYSPGSFTLDVRRRVI